MNIEEAIKYIKNDIEIDKDTASWFEKGNKTKEQIEESINAYETLLTAYEEKCKELKKEIQDDLDVRNRWGLTLQELEKEKEKNKELEDMIISHKKQLKQSGIYGYDYDLKILKEE